MKRLLISSVIVHMILFCAGCSKEPPPDSFLNARLRIITGINKDKPDGVDTQQLRMKTVDLFSAIDRNIRKKYWKKEHENSFTLIVKTGKDPSTKMKTTFEFTLVRIPNYKDDVVVKGIVINGRTISSNEIIQMMRMLDQAKTGGPPPTQ